MIQQYDTGKVKQIHNSQKIESRIKVKIKIRPNYKADRRESMIQRRKKITYLKALNYKTNL